MDFKWINYFKHHFFKVIICLLLGIASHIFWDGFTHPGGDFDPKPASGFMFTGPMGAGNPGNLGPCALIDIDGVRVMVVSHKMQALDQAILRHVGVEPSECPILVLKSSVHFRADFAPIAERIIVGVAPGPVVADPAFLNFRYVRPEVRRRPRTG